MLSSLFVGFEALRANPLRSLLSTLGVVMGVGAMVSVLSMGDGVERYAREQLERTTDLLEVMVSPQTGVSVDGQSLRRDDFTQFGPSDVAAIRTRIPQAARVSLAASSGVLVRLGADAAPRAFAVRGVEVAAAAATRPAPAAGQWFADRDTAVAVVNDRVAAVLSGDSSEVTKALGLTLALRGAPHRIVGVIVEADRAPTLDVWVPIADAARALPPNTPHRIAVTARRIEDVEGILAALEGWAGERFGARWKDEVVIASRRARAEQAASAMLVFKLLMGAITGVALLVGGVGIMNVLLATVAERTREIGIRKAAGAKQRDILVQFLAESVAIASTGAALGVLLGISVAYGAAWVMRAQTDAPVYAAVTVGTVAFAVGISVAIGLVFGLYPARRAARLSPIEAIRHES
ncbi:MAG: ABC transporter permease [Gemmatimonadaceae bacterium]|nr:ABC transporter permease [Gemmatimonadaceae bacterium]MCW5825649.1 ABC transporter permease [Gemmatimonadaceae bacterium]